MPVWDETANVETLINAIDRMVKGVDRLGRWEIKAEGSWWKVIFPVRLPDSGGGGLGLLGVLEYSSESLYTTLKMAYDRLVIDE